MKKRLFILCLSILTFNSYSQIFKNSSGEGVFFTEKAKQLSVETEFSKKTSSASLQLNSPLKSIKYHKKDNDTIFTLQTSYSILTKLDLVNTQSITKGLENPEVSFKLGLIKTIDSLNTSIFVKPAISWGASTKITYNNKKVLYDTINKVKSTKHPYSFSLDFNAEIYPKKVNCIAIGIVAGYKNTNNYDDLDSFQNLPLDYLDNNISYIKDSEDGKIGDFKTLNNYYLGISIPYFPFEFKKSSNLFGKVMKRVAIVPYYRNTFGDSNISNWGASFSFVDIGLRNESFSALFNSGFSIGLDWVKKGDKTTSNIFIGGKFSIDGIIKDLTKLPE